MNHCRPHTDRTVQEEHSTEFSPFLQTEEVSLYCGDVLRLIRTLPQNSIDALITDPPYCSGGHSLATKQADPSSKYCQNGNSCGRPSFGGDMRDQRSYKYWCTEWLSLCREAAKESAYCLVFIDWRQLPTMTDCIQAAGWSWRGVISWDKGRAARAPHKGYFRHQCEYVVWATNGKVPKHQDRGPFDGCFHIPVRQVDKHHMTGKPTNLMRELVRTAPVNGTVLDPFAGSFSTGVAALLEERKFIGFEATQAYCEIGKHRVEAALKGELIPATRTAD